MKKLEIKHLAPYLPYQLRGIYTLSDVVNLSSGQQDEQREKILDIENPKFFLTYCKPYLRPLSDLTAPIAIDGETFIPINKLKGIYGWDYLWDEVHEGKRPLNINALKYASVTKLLEWHFDVFGLIDAGLAIDINTLHPQNLTNK